MNKITLVWQKDKNTIWESDWIHFLFKDITLEIVDNLDHNKFINNSVIIDLLHNAPYHNEYVQEMYRRKYNFGLVHLTDEGSNNDISSYQYCNFVVRNFYRKDMNDHVLTVPLGWTTGNRNLSKDKSSNERKLDWCCIIQRTDRNRQLASYAFEFMPNGLFYAAEQHGPRLSVEKMSEIYKDSKFVLCPGGRITPESFRTFESLESGSIPIVLKNDYWKICYGDDFPALQVNSWEEAKIIIEQMLKKPEELEAYRLNCLNWWNDSKIKTKQQVEHLVEKTIYKKEIT